jgi:hypothetical protein
MFIVSAHFLVHLRLSNVVVVRRRRHMARQLVPTRLPFFVVVRLRVPRHAPSVARAPHLYIETRSCRTTFQNPLQLRTSRKCVSVHCRYPFFRRNATILGRGRSHRARRRETENELTGFWGSSSSWRCQALGRLLRRGPFFGSWDRTKTLPCLPCFRHRSK